MATQNSNKNTPLQLKHKKSKGSAALYNKKVMLPIICTLLAAVICLTVLIVLDANGFLYGSSCEGEKEPGDEVSNGAELLDGTVYPSGNYEYRLFKDGTAELHFYNDSFATQLSVPSEIDGHAVTAIGENCFFLMVSLTEVDIPEGVTYIGKSAFEGCGSLLNLSLPSTLTAIGDNAFKNCPADVEVRFAGDHEKIKIGEGNDVIISAFSGN